MRRPPPILVAIAAALLPAILSAQISWEPANAGIGAIDVASLNVTRSGAILAGVMGGTYRSTDAGISWRLSGPASYARFALDSTGGIYSVGRNGTYRSTDDGITWTKVSNLSDALQLESAPDGRLYAITAQGIFALFGDEPTRDLSLTLYRMRDARLSVGASGTIFLWSWGYALRRSPDDGATWNLVSWQQLSALAVAPDGILLGGNISGGLVRSSDTGRTWSTNDEFRPGEFSFGPHGEILATAVDAYRGGLRISTDGGVTWTLTADVSPRPSIGPAVMGRNGELVRVTYGSIYRSTNLGETWTRAVSGIPSGSVNVPAVAALPDGRLLAEVPADIIGEMAYMTHGAREGGLFSSSDDGGTWTRVSNAPGGTGLEVKGNGIFLSTDWTLHHPENGTPIPTSIVHGSFDGGVTWTGRFTTNLRRPATAGPGGRYGIVISGRWPFPRIQGLQITSDNGKTWTLTNLPSTVIWSTFTPKGGLLAHVVEIPDTGATPPGAYHLLRSTDEGKNWSTVLDSVDAGRIVTDRAGRMFVVIRDFVDTSSIAARLLRSTDDGASWEPVMAGYRDWERSTFVTPNGTLYFGRYRSIDGGATWNLVKNMKDVVDSLIVASDDRFVALKDGELTTTSDGGATWTPAMDGLPGPVVNAITVGRDGHLLAGTSAGIFKASIAIASVTGPASDAGFALDIRPNPFASGTRAMLRLPASDDVRVDLIDRLGRVAATLVDGPMEAGEHAVAIDGSELSSGLYFCRVTTSRGSTASMLVRAR